MAQETWKLKTRLRKVSRWTIIFMSSVVVLYIGSNIYFLNELDDYSPLTQMHPRLPIKNGIVDQKYVAAVYYNKNSDSIVLCSYAMVDGYKYLFYEPQEISKHFGVIRSSGYPESIYEHVPFSGSKLLGTIPNDLISIDHIPDQLFIRNENSAECDTFNLKVKHDGYKMDIAWYEKLTWGPITEM